LTKLLLVISAALILISGRAAADEILIIGSPSITVNALDPNQIAAIYLLRITNWPDGTHIVPVNREAVSAIRAEFTSRVLRQDNASLATYWNEMHFMGKMPPIVQQSEQAMLAFVRRVPGAIGYVSAATVPTGVKVLARIADTERSK
jgi:ABC-type phosphate transport system substrate-binding protein